MPRYWSLTPNSLHQLVQVCGESSFDCLGIGPALPPITRKNIIAVLRVLQFPIEDAQFAAACSVAALSPMGSMRRERKGHQYVDSMFWPHPAGRMPAEVLAFDPTIYRPLCPCQPRPVKNGRPRARRTRRLPGAVGQLIDGDEGLALEAVVLTAPLAFGRIGEPLGAMPGMPTLHSASLVSRTPQLAPGPLGGGFATFSKGIRGLGGSGVATPPTPRRCDEPITHSQHRALLSRPRGR